MIDVNKLRDEWDVSRVISRYVPLKKSGREMIGMCPFHDEAKPSLMVNDKKRIWKCFGCGESGDVIQFVMKHKSISFLDACKSIVGDGDEYVTGDTKITPRAIEDDTIYSRSDAYPQNLFHANYGYPNRVWYYHDEEGYVIGCVCRFDFEGGHKEVLPVSFIIEDGISHWAWKGFKIKRPLYNRHLIERNPNAVIVMVEGEKTADAGQPFFSEEQLIFSTWVGGANGIVNTDFFPLKGRRVIFLPDHDTEQRYGDTHEKAGEIKPWHEQPGNQAMLGIHGMIKDTVLWSRWISVPDEYPNKWDIADQEWTIGSIKLFLRLNLIKVPIIK